MPDIQGQVADNRRNVQRLDGNFVVVPDRQDQNLNFNRNTIEVSVSASIYTRPLNDSLVSGHPDEKHGSGRGVAGDVRGDWTQANLTVQSADFTRDGRNAVRDALDGQSGSIDQSGVGTGGGEVSPSDAALAAETGRSYAQGVRSTEANNAVRGRSEYRFAETGPSEQDLTEWGLFDSSGRLLCRVVTDALPKTAEDEVRVDITLSFVGSAQTGGVITDEGEATMAEAMKLEAVTVGLDEMAWGTGTADPQESDTALGTEQLRKPLQRVLDLETITTSAPQFESEPAGQPYDYTEVGVFDNNGRLVYRVTFDPFEKDSTVRFTTSVGFRIV